MFLSLAVTAALAALLAATWPYLEDDGFIHLEFARNLAAGHGYAFHGHQSYGDSSPLWPLILVAAHAVTGNWFVAAKSANVVACAAALAGVFRLASAVARRHRLHSSMPYAALLLTLVGPYFLFWVFSGMEAVAAMALAVWMSWLAATQAPTRQRFLLLAVLAGVAPLVRGEMVLLSALTMTVAAVRLLAQSRKDAVAWRLALGCLAMGAAMAALPLGAWSAYALRHFGTIVPNTNAAKRLLGVTRANPVSAGVHLLGVGVVGFGGELLGGAAAALLLLFGGLTRRRADAGRIDSDRCVLTRSEWCILAGWPILLCMFYCVNRTAVQTRYLLPAGGCFTVGAVALIYTWASRYPRRTCATSSGGACPPRLPLRDLLRVAVIAVFAVPLFVDVRVLWPFLRNKVACTIALHQFLVAVEKQVPATEPIAVYAVGQAGFELPNPIVDLGGLIDPEAQRYLTNDDAMHSWALGKGVRYFITFSAAARPDSQRLFEWKVPPLGWRFSRQFWASSESAALDHVRDETTVKLSPEERPTTSPSGL